MRYLLEDEAKSLLASAGIPIPRSWGDGAVPDDESGPFVVKVLVEEGGRGLRGGVCKVEYRSNLDDATQRMLKKWSGADPFGVHTEEQVQDVLAELYLGVVADRDRAVPLLLIGVGGVSVEQRGVERIPMSPVEPWRPYVERRIVQLLARDAPDVEPGPVMDVARCLVGLYYDRGAHLLEINPLGLRADGTAIALDAKVVLPGPPSTKLAQSDELPALARRLGINVVDGGGDIAVITSGAGLLMATVDLLGDRGASFGPLIDLGGLVFGQAEHVPAVLEAVLERRPRRVLISYFLQLASCMVLAERIVVGVAGTDAEIVVRQRGVDAVKARQLLESVGCRVVEDLAEACALTVPAVTVGR